MEGSKLCTTELRYWRKVYFSFVNCLDL